MAGSEFIAVTLAYAPLALFAYCWIVYPAVLMIAGRGARPTDGATLSDDPPLTILLVAHNAARSLPGALDALIADDYTPSRRRILVVSDGSSDTTTRIARAYRQHNVECLALRRRVGKTAAENRAWRRISGDYVVCLDAGSRVERGALRALIAAVRRPGIGVASGTDVVVEHDRGSAEAAYVRAEMWVRELETAAGGIVGASGCLYAMRRSIFNPDLRPSLARDFASVLEARRHHLRAVAVPGARCHVSATGSLRHEYRRKMRTALQGLATLLAYRRLLNPLCAAGFAFRLASHKLARWLIPLSVPLALAGVAHLAIEADRDSRIVMVACLLIAVVVTVSLETMRYAAMVVLAVARAWSGIASGRSIAYWTPTVRPGERVVDCTGPIRAAVNVGPPGTPTRGASASTRASAHVPAQ